MQTGSEPLEPLPGIGCGLGHAPAGVTAQTELSSQPPVRHSARVGGAGATLDRPALPPHSPHSPPALAADRAEHSRAAGPLQSLSADTPPPSMPPQRAAPAGPGS